MKHLITLFILLFLFTETNAQTADNYFHNSANTYYQGNIAQAKSTVLEGLQKFPNDAKLNKMKKKLDDEEQKKKKEEEQKKKEDEKKKQEEQKEKEEEDKDKQDQNKDQQQDENKKQEEKDKQEQQQKPQPQPSKLTEKQAEQLLNALAQEEKKLHDKKEKGKAMKVKVEKDW